jgi:hypothetical protein
VFSFAVALRLVEGAKWFRKRSFSKGPVLGSFFPRWSFLRLTDQQIYLLLQKKQLLLHLVEQGNKISIGSLRYRGWSDAGIFVHCTWLPFAEFGDYGHQNIKHAQFLEDCSLTPNDKVFCLLWLIYYCRWQTFDYRGEAVLCCNAYNATIPFCNIKDRNTIELWHNKKHRKAHNMIHSGF